MTGTGFARMATVNASTKRMSTVNGTSGLAGTSITHLVSLYVTPPCALSTPVSARSDVTMIGPMLDNPFELLQSFCEGDPDVVKGDTLVIAGKDYEVAFVEDWSFKTDHRLRFILHKPDDR